MAPKYTRGNLVFELEPLNGLSYCFEILHGYTLIFHVTVEIIFVVKISVIRPVITCCHGNRGLNIWYKIHPPFSPLFLFKSMINNIPESNK